MFVPEDSPHEIDRSARRGPGDPAGGGRRRPCPGDPPAPARPPPPGAVTVPEAGSIPGAPDAPAPPVPRASSGLEAESLPRELAEDIYQAPAAPRLGPTPVSDVRFLMDNLGLRNVFGDSGIRAFGWVEGGYSGCVDRLRPALRPAPAEPVRQRVPAQPDRPGAPEAAPAGPVRLRLQHPIFRRRRRGPGPAQGRHRLPGRQLAASARTSATCTSRPTCRSSPRAAWT